MGLLSRSLGINALSLEDPTQPLIPTSALFESLGLGRSDAGVLVNEKQALRMSTVYSCIRIISEDLSRLSLDIFQSMPDDSLRKATDHKNYYLLHNRPNPDMSSMTWRAAMICSMCGFGNGYSWIKRDRAARVIALVPLDPGKTHPIKVKGELYYATTQTESGQVTIIEPDNVLHFRSGVTQDGGLTGSSPIQMCKNTIGLGIAAEKFSSQFFANGARATGVMSHPQHLDTEAYENLKKSIHELMSGDQALRPIILEEGMDWKQISISPDDAQMILSMKWSKEEVAQLFRVPLHLLQDLTRSTNNNIEFQGMEYVRHCLMPYAVSMEAEINYKIIGKGNFAVEHNFMDLQRGDFASQTTALIALRANGIYSANDCLRALRQNPIPTDEGGDLRVLNGAFVGLDRLMLADGEAAVPETAGTNTDEGTPAATHRHQILNSFRPIFRDAVGRAINRKNNEDFVRKAFQPAVCSMFSAILASKYGQAELTNEDLGRVASIVSKIAVNSKDWTKESASIIVTSIVEEVYDGLTTEIQ